MTHIKNASQIISHIGFVTMLAATVVGMAELAEREGHRTAAALQLQPVYAYATEHSENTEGSEHLRRGGREEIHHASATYGAARRSHSVAGTL